ncbi:uncharacterized protein EV422DRAFT_335852 [Fimicolochytrium jonesii]|uniref:uncharacterized protein n=1 Tax=Fimicolochytrium jonesii TaxID=1396493 RepID=UPI0022FF1253|nr:uncharacterized protein EV422DRAFT_335852 [Fimicolochytrium jonesii]KAI8815923.1 hypothetical protein EV422DRAFT_335852 [Fimicolochytrium jonesii]
MSATRYSSRVVRKGCRATAAAATALSAFTTPHSGCLLPFLSPSLLHCRPISVRAARAAIKLQQQKQGSSDSKAAEEARKQKYKNLATKDGTRRGASDPYEPGTLLSSTAAALTAASSLPLDAQRAVHLFHRAAVERNVAVAVANYRLLAARDLETALPFDDLVKLLRMLGEPLMLSGDYIPTEADMETWQAIFSTLRRVRVGISPPHMIPGDVYRIIFVACARMQNTLGMQEAWEAVVEDQARPEVQVYDDAIMAFAKDGLIKQADSVFAALKERVDIAPGFNTYAALIKARAVAADLDGALLLMKELLSMDEKIPIVIFNTLMEAYLKKLMIAEMEHLFIQLDEHKTLPNIITYHIMLDGYAKTGDAPHALALIQRMRSEVETRHRPDCAPNTVTLNIVMDLFRNLDQVENAVAIFHELTANVDKSQRIRPDKITFTTLIDAFRRRNDLDSMNTYFHAMQHEHGISPTAAQFSVFMRYYADTGDARAVVKIYTDMRARKIQPIRSTFLNLVRAHEIAGQPDGAARWYWEARKRGLTPNIGTVNAALRAQCAVPASAHPTLMTVVQDIYTDALRCDKVDTSCVTTLLQAHLRAGSSVSRVVEGVYEREFEQRGVKPDQGTLMVLINRGMRREEVVAERMGREGADPTTWDPIIAYLQTRRADPDAKSTPADTTATTVTTSTDTPGPTPPPAPLAPPTLHHTLHALATHTVPLPFAPPPAKLEARALLRVYRDVVHAHPNRPVSAAVLYALAKRMDELLGAVDWAGLLGLTTWAGGETGVAAEMEGRLEASEADGDVPKDA